MLKAKKEFMFEPDYAIPPGETLKEVMESLDMTQKELSVRTWLYEKIKCIVDEARKKVNRENLRLRAHKEFSPYCGG